MAIKLQIEGLSKVYGNTTALEPTDLQIEAGEFLTLLGPSGSGKTTLLQMICGLTQPTAGRILIDGKDETHTPVHRRDLGLVFQHYALFPHLTVAENVAFPLEMRGASKADVQRRVRQTLELVHMEHLAGRFPAALSGGQQQRVALARCFIYEPSIILMDEPLGALDRKLREHLQIEIKQLHRKTGATILYVTHDQEEALAMSDRICLMRHARVEQIGPPRDIYLKPATAFAAQFIGTSNLIRGEAATSNGIPGLVAGGTFITLPSAAGPDGQQAAVAVRPEVLKFDGAGENRIPAIVAETIFAGSEIKVLADAKDHGLFTVRLATSETPPPFGSPVTVTWKASDSVVVTP